MGSITSRPRSLLIAAAALVLGLGLLWFGVQGPLSMLGLSSMGGGDGAPTTAIFVPRRSPLAVSLLVNPDRLVKLPQVDLDNFEEGLLDSAHLDYEQDIRPWLGDEVTLAVTTLDLDREPSNGQQPGYLLALAAKNSTRAREFLQVYWQRRAADGTELHYEQVSGVKLIYGDTSPGPEGQAQGQKTVASALVGDRFILFANTPKVIRDAVNNVQVPELNLASDEDYQRSLETLSRDRFALAYANLGELGGWLENQGLAVNRALTEASPSSELAANTATDPRYRGLALGLGVTRQGLLADTVLLSTPSSSQSSDESSGNAPAGNAPSDPAMAETSSPTTAVPGGSPKEIFQYLPSDSIAVAASNHLDEFWQSAQPLLKAYPALGTLTDRALDHIQADWQIDITQEIFPWVTGEYALGQLHQPKSPSSSGVDWIFVVDRDAPEAEAGIQHLDEIARSQGYSIGALTLADRDVTAWTSLTPEGDQASAANAIRAFVRGIHAQVDHYELFATSLDAMEQVLQTIQGKPLSQTAEFKQAVAPLPETNQGYFYVNWQENSTLLSEEIPLLRVLELTAQPLFRTLKTASLSRYESQPEEGVQRAAIALQLGQ